MGLDEAALEQWYNDPANDLLLGSEIYVGGGANDTQDCHGDSGGPLLKNGKIYGVVSGGLGTADKSCAFGGTYAKISAATRDFVQRATQWTDPCTGFTVRGACAGTVATRCTDKFEGDRALSVVDCADLGQTCMADADGRVGCFDVGSDPSQSSSTPKPVAPTIDEARTSVMRAFAHHRDARITGLDQLRAGQ
jgi:hypothetical protein